MGIADQHQADRRDVEKTGHQLALLGGDRVDDKGVGQADRIADNIAGDIQPGHDGLHQHAEKDADGGLPDDQDGGRQDPGRCRRQLRMHHGFHQEGDGHRQQQAGPHRHHGAAEAGKEGERRAQPGKDQQQMEGVGGEEVPQQIHPPIRL